MADVNFTNQSTGFSMWYDELTGTTAGKGNDYLNLDTESGSAVTVTGKGFAYDNNGQPLYGAVDSVKIVYAGNAADGPGDLIITNLKVDLAAFKPVLTASTEYERTTAFWSATLSGNDTINFGTKATQDGFSFSFAGDGYSAPQNAIGGNDKVRGDLGTSGTLSGDFLGVNEGRTAFGGNDDIRLTGSYDSLVVGDFSLTSPDVRLFAGNDYIQVGDKGVYVIGDVTILYGSLQAGNDTIMGGTAGDELIGDLSHAYAGASFRAGHDEIHGGGGADAIYGDYSTSNTTSFIGGNDKLYGDTGTDYIEGQEGNDTLDGGADGDWLYGGSGNDMLRGGTGKDLISGGDGVDTADYRDKSQKVEITINTNGMATAKVNGVAEDTLEDVENIFGGSAGDKITGDSTDGANRFDGGGGNDSLNGGAGKDTLIGGTGNDKLTGGADADAFVFKGALGSSNVDTITDFAHGTDEIALDDAVFKALGSSVSSSEFVARSAGHAATNGSQHIIYDKSNGTLWYDADGNGYKSVAVQFAQLGTSASHPTNLTWDDFAIV